MDSLEEGENGRCGEEGKNKLLERCTLYRPENNVDDPRQVQKGDAERRDKTDAEWTAKMRSVRAIRVEVHQAEWYSASDESAP